MGPARPLTEIQTDMEDLFIEASNQLSLDEYLTLLKFAQDESTRRIACLINVSKNREESPGD